MTVRRAGMVPDGSAPRCDSEWWYREVRSSCLDHFRDFLCEMDVQMHALALKDINISFPVSPMTKFGAERSDSRADISVLDMIREGFRILVVNNCDTS